MLLKKKKKLCGEALSAELFSAFKRRRRGREIFFCNHEFFPKGNML